MKSVANGPGSITVTLIPNVATSCANVSAKPSTANLVLVNAEGIYAIL